MRKNRKEGRWKTQKTMCMVIVISLAIALSMYFYPLDFNGYCSFPPFNIPWYDSDCVVNAGDSIDLNFSIIPREAGTIVTEVYGDIVQLEKWNATLNGPSTLTLFEENKHSLTLDVPSNACTTEYGLIYQWLWKGEVTARAEVFVNVTNGLPYEYSRIRYNHTGYITGDNMPRDIYLPKRPFPVTVWFKVNVSGLYYLDGYVVTGAELIGIRDRPMYVEANMEYTWTVDGGDPNYPFLFNLGPTGGTSYFISNIKTSDGGEAIDTLNVTVIRHCPGGENPPPPITEANFIAMPDVNGDLRVDMRDIGICCNCYMFTPESPEWNPDADINKDEVVDMRDIGIACAGFGMHT